MSRGRTIVTLVALGLLYATNPAQAAVTKTLHSLDFGSPTNDPAAGRGYGKIAVSSATPGSAVVAFIYYGLKPRTTYVVTLNDGTADITVGQFTTNKYGVGALRPQKVTLTVPDAFPSAALHEGTATGTVVLTATRGGPTGAITTATCTR